MEEIPKLIQVPASSLNMNAPNNPYSQNLANMQAKRLYVGNIPLSTDEGEITEFFDRMMEANSYKTAGPGSVITNANVNHDKNFAFLELRSMDETTNAMFLDGVQFQGCELKIRRPRDYQPGQTWSVSGDYQSLPANFQVIFFRKIPTLNCKNKNSC